MVTFMRGEDFFLSAGQIYVKLLPNGESVQLTNDAGAQVRTGVYTGWLADRVHATGHSRVMGYLDCAGARGEPTRLLPNASGLTWIADHRVLFAEIMAGHPHGDCDRDGKPGGLAGDLFPAE